MYCGTPTLRPENSVDIWNLLWLSRRVIICTEQTCIYILSTCPNTLTSEWAKNHEITSMTHITITLKFKMSHFLEKHKNKTTETTKGKENRLRRLQGDI